jgi:signal transduction histidine kinase
MIIAQNPDATVEKQYRQQVRVSKRMALVDAYGNIVAVDSGWTALAKETDTALERVGPGVNYLQVCRRSAASSEAAQKAVIGLEEVLRGSVPSFEMDYECMTPARLGYFRMTVTPLLYGDVRAAITHTDITDDHASKEKEFKRLQHFAHRLINAQEEERKRISREIHDDVGNRTALVALLVRQITKDCSSANPSAMLPELRKVLDSITDLAATLRNISHALHPASLRYVGIGAALNGLQDGFHRTSGIETDIVIPRRIPRLPDDVELCIFRITQECLQNIVKHAGSKKVKVVVEYTGKCIQLTVSDKGCGFSPSEAVRRGGLGLLSMEERAVSVGGHLTIRSSPGRGTEVRLTIPLQEEAE